MTKMAKEVKMSLLKSSLRILMLTVVDIVAIGGLVLWSLTTDRRTDVSTRVERKSLRFYKQGLEWFADVAGHTQAQNQMVAGADTLLDVMSNGGSEVKVVLSADIDNPDETCSAESIPKTSTSIRLT